jgi:hypothetical protein
MWRALIPAIVLLCCCGNVSFDVDQDLPTETVQGGLLGMLGTLLPTPFNFTINLQQQEQMHGTGPAKSAQLTSLTMAITPHDMPVGDFSFLQEAHLFVSASGLAKVEIANITSVPSKATTLSFNIVPNVDLVPYIQAGADISATASGSQPPQDTSFDGHLTVTVHI